MNKYTFEEWFKTFVFSSSVGKSMIKFHAESAFHANDEYIESLETQIEELTRQRDLYKKACDFYGDASSWVFERMRCNESAIRREDISLPNKYKTSGSGGKLAREIQKEVEDE